MRSPRRRSCCDATPQSTRGAVGFAEPGIASHVKTQMSERRVNASRQSSPVNPERHSKASDPPIICQNVSAQGDTGGLAFLVSKVA